MDIEQAIAMFVFAFTASITPGPNNLMLMMSGNLFGWRASVPHILGIVIGVAVLVVCAVYGLTALLKQAPWLTLAVRLVGTGWLMWLGVRFLWSAFKRSDDANRQQGRAARPLKFYEAALFQWANPKAVLIATSAAGAFITLAPTAFERAVLLSLGFCISALISTHVWTLAGSALATLMQSGNSAKYVQGAMGVLMILTAASLLVL